MDSGADLNLTLLGLSRAFKEAAREHKQRGMLSGLGATETMMNMFQLIVDCFHLVQMLCMMNTLGPL